MIQVTLSTIYNKIGIGFKFKFDDGSPSKNEVVLLKPYLTIKAMKILMSYIATKCRLNRQSQSEK